MSEKPAAEQQTEQQIKVRQVTDVHANWNEEERGAPGKFSFQLILDNGAEEYAIRPPAEDADALMDLFAMSETMYFDLERQVLIFNNISLGGDQYPARFLRTGPSSGPVFVAGARDRRETFGQEKAGNLVWRPAPGRSDFQG